MGLRRVDSADIPATAKDPVLSTLGPSQKKRRLQYEASFGSQNSPPSSSQPSSSQPSSSQPLRRISGPPLSQIAQPVEEIDMEDEPEEESRDELYVMLKTSIVGIQYYKGELFSVSFRCSCLMPETQGSSDGERRYRLCGSHVTSMIGMLFKLRTSEAHRFVIMMILACHAQLNEPNPSRSVIYHELLRRSWRLSWTAVLSPLRASCMKAIVRARASKGVCFS